MNNSNGCFGSGSNYSCILHLAYGIKKGDKVLDIGGGSKPFPYATHILDKQDEKYNNQRYGRDLQLLKGQILISGTTDKLKEFKDNEWNFIYCSHILEHIDNLPEVLKEISRVGKRGFVAIPHYIGDFFAVNSAQGHKWFSDYKNEILYIKKREPLDFHNEFAGYWKNFIWNKGQERPRDIWEGHNGEFGLRFLWEIRFFWKNRIDFQEENWMNTFFKNIEYYRAYQKHMEKQK